MTEQQKFELLIEAKLDKLPEVLQFLDLHLEEYMCPMKVQMELDIAVEEIFVNIASYAYPGRTGDARIVLSFERDDSGKLAVVITFSDQGVYFDPLSHLDPDITLSAEERQIGGLGILMVKKSMDDVFYEYLHGKNILTIKKYLES